jgi:hypothetical protein
MRWIRERRVDGRLSIYWLPAVMEMEKTKGGMAEGRATAVVVQLFAAFPPFMRRMWTLRNLQAQEAGKKDRQQRLGHLRTMVRATPGWGLRDKTDQENILQQGQRYLTAFITSTTSQVYHAGTFISRRQRKQITRQHQQQGRTKAMVPPTEPEVMNEEGTSTAQTDLRHWISAAATAGRAENRAEAGRGIAGSAPERSEANAGSAGDVGGGGQETNEGIASPVRGSERNTAAGREQVQSAAALHSRRWGKKGRPNTVIALRFAVKGRGGKTGSGKKKPKVGARSHWTQQRISWGTTTGEVRRSRGENQTHTQVPVLSARGRGAQDGRGSPRGGAPSRTLKEGIG